MKAKRPIFASTTLALVAALSLAAVLQAQQTKTKAPAPRVAEPTKPDSARNSRPLPENVDVSPW